MQAPARRTAPTRFRKFDEDMSLESRWAVLVSPFFGYFDITPEPFRDCLYSTYGGEHKSFSCPVRIELYALSFAAQGYGHIFHGLTYGHTLYTNSEVASGGCDENETQT